MFIRLIIALALLMVLFYLMARYRRLPENKRRQWMIKVAVGAFVAVMLLGVVSGKMHWLGGLLAAVVGFAKFGFSFMVRVLPFLRILGNQGFGNPVFSTEFLKVQINLGQNSITGAVIKGPYKDSALESLNDQQLAELEEHYKNLDNRSYYLIRVIRQRMGGGRGQQQNHSQQDYRSVSDPSYDEALQILGLEEYVGKAQPEKDRVVKAHRRLMQKLHPDHGGNDYLASRVNVAKEIVLKKIKT
ncbi:hypothetical protein SAMN02745866_01880 [Alteromonadaceae bacterium Bs31]|nr:hypothetical protein SAMN02745866_01880 [Alteromonadaceae bacterium Bs31]